MAFYAVMKLRWKPSDFIFLPPKEKALMYAFILQQVEAEKKQQAKTKAGRKPSRSGRRRR